MAETNWRFDFKQITALNWLEIDEASSNWCSMTAVAKTDEEWIKFFFSPQLEQSVPQELAKLLEVARGSMIYGICFRPLLTLGAEQCYRLLDTGTRIRCNQLGIPTTFKKGKGRQRETSFKENIDALIKKGVISNTDKDCWDHGRSLRNISSHPERQLIRDPAQAEDTLFRVVELLNNLFRKQAPK